VSVLRSSLALAQHGNEPPLRWAAGADAIRTLEQKARRLLAQADAHRELSSSLAFDEAEGAGSGS